MKYGTSADCTQSVVNTVRTSPSVVQCVDVLEERIISCCLVTVDTSALNALNPMDSYGIKPVSFREPRPALFVKQYSQSRKICVNLLKQVYLCRRCNVQGGPSTILICYWTPHPRIFGAERERAELETEDEVRAGTEDVSAAKRGLAPADTELASEGGFERAERRMILGRRRARRRSCDGCRRGGSRRRGQCGRCRRNNEVFHEGIEGRALVRAEGRQLLRE